MAAVVVQDDVNVNDVGTPFNTLAKAFTGNITTGSAIVVFGGFGNNDQTPTVADTLGNTYTLPSGGKLWDATATQGQFCRYALNSPGGANTVTITYPSQGTFCRMWIVEVSGILTASALDQFVQQVVASPGTGTDGASSGNFTTTNPDDMVIAWFQDVAGVQGTITAGTGYTGNDSIDSGGLVARGESRLLSTTGTFAGTFTLAGNNRCLVSALSLKAAAGATAGLDVPRNILSLAAVKRAANF